MKIQGEVKVKAKIGIKKREVIEKEEVEVAKEEKVEVIVVVEVKKEIKEIEVEEGEIEVGLIALVKVMIIGKKILIQEEMTEIASKMKTMIEIMTEDIKKIFESNKELEDQWFSLNTGTRRKFKIDNL